MLATMRGRESADWDLRSIVAALSVSVAGYFLNQAFDVDPRGLLVFSSTVFVAAISGRFIWLWLFAPRDMRLGHVFALMSAVAFSGKGFGLWFGEAVLPDPIGESRALWILVVCQGSLVFLQFVERLVMRRNDVCLADQIYSLAGRILPRAGLYLFLVIIGRTVTQGLAVGMGIVLTGDASSEVTLGISATDSITLILSPVFRVASLILGWSFICLGGRLLRWIGIALVAVEFVLTLTDTRRWILAWVMISALIWRFLNSRRRVGPSQLLFFVASTALVVAVIWPISLGVRSAVESFDFAGLSGEQKVVTLVEDVIPQVLGEFSLTQTYQTGSDYVENLRARLGIVDFGAEIDLAQSEGYPYMHGGAAWEGFLQVVPRIIWPSKGHFSPELAIEEFYGMPLYDAASTLVACGLADFGVLGVLLNLGLFGALLALGQAYLGWSRVPIVGMLMLSVCVLAAYEVESDSTAIFTLVRYLIMLPVVEMGLRFFGVGNSTHAVDLWRSVPRGG